MAQKGVFMNSHQHSMRQMALSQGSFADRIAKAGLGLALIAGIAAILSGFGSRFGWWYFRTGFTLLRVAAIGGIVAAAISLSGGVLARHERRGAVFFAAAAGILIGLLTAGIPWSWEQRAKQLPFIHDITTDMVNPPQFKAIQLPGQSAVNPPAYGGPETAALQKRAYPDIRPFMLSASPASAFAVALAAAKQMGWRIIDSNEQEGRIEAIATTFWFGFKDDVVVRVTPEFKGSRVDIRSASRVGRSDIGTNAERIRSFLRSLKEASVPKDSSEDVRY
jgi:uncharacterized protein (DUF1499 family)